MAARAARALKVRAGVARGGGVPGARSQSGPAWCTMSSSFRSERPPRSTRSSCPSPASPLTSSWSWLGSPLLPPSSRPTVAESPNVFSSSAGRGTTAGTDLWLHATWWCVARIPCPSRRHRGPRPRPRLRWPLTHMLHEFGPSLSLPRSASAAPALRSAPCRLLPQEAPAARDGGTLHGEEHSRCTAPDWGLHLRL